MDTREPARTPGGGSGSPREPKYWVLKQRLLERTQALAPGSPIPPERALATEFGTSRTTVRQAVQELVVEGRLRRIQGRGTFVTKPKLAQALRLTSYTEDMRAQGLRPDSRLLEIAEVRADETLAARLAVSPGAAVVRIRRLRMADGEPMAIETTHLAAARFPGLRQHIAQPGSPAASLYDVLARQYGVHLAEAEETIETALASPAEATLLGTDAGLPLLLLSRHSFDTEGRPVEWVRSLYRGDRYKFVARLRRPGPAAA